uniref:Uncharacterized protein n=1 Tax=Arundo donax TaxID=35708 RepID=A0A0A9GR47_ARUDO
MLHKAFSRRSSLSMQVNGAVYT